jgi:aminopeptidase N
MRKLIITGLLLLSNVCFSQQDKLPISRQKDGAAVQGVNFFQDKKMDYYDIKYLKLDITVQPRSVSISANCTYKVQVQQALDTFVIEFKETMVLDSVFVNSNKSAFIRSNNHIYVPLNPAPAGTILNVIFYYKGNVASGFFAGRDDKGFEYTASVSEAYQAREWYPAKQLLNDKIDSTDIWITTGSEYKAGSNGLLTSVMNLPNNLTQYRWSTRYPLNYYMPSIAVGNYLEYNIYAKPSCDGS